MEFLFEPFRRLRYARTQQPRGSGLGLSIVRAVVHAHHGTVHTHPAKRRRPDVDGVPVITGR